MIKVIITKGLPGSGKSTWAKDIIKKNPNSYKRINKDDLREMLDCSHYSKGAEEFVLKIRDSIIKEAITSGKHVIVDDTNLQEKHEINIRNLVKGLGVEVQIKSFLDVPLAQCIKNDLKREKTVGEKVIMEMYNKFIKTSNIKEKYEEDISLPHAIIVDIDGTLAIKKDRSPFDWNKVGEDDCNETIKNISNSYKGNVIVLSGRDGVCKDLTINWLKKHNIRYDNIFMKEQGDCEKDCIVKRRLFEENIRGKFYIEYVLDDRNQVVEMWRDMGLICLQVAEGNF